jgi:hypothetical protein
MIYLGNARVQGAVGGGTVGGGTGGGEVEGA